jgi:flagellin-like hook-associated protein FlgL
MKTSASIKAATKFKFSGGNGSVRLLTVAAKSASELAAIKAEIKDQYDQLQKLSSSARIAWLAGDATHATVANWKAGDEAFASQVTAALDGGSVKSAATPASAPSAKLPADTEKSASAKAVFKTGEQVKARGKGGTRWWDAVITNVSGDEIAVKYTDGAKEVLPLLSIAHLNQPNSSIEAGQEVLAKWSDGQYYTGFVKSFDDKSITIKWKDGSAPSKVPYSSVEVPGK